MATFEELDVRGTQLGELILRRRRTITLGDQWVYEVKLDGRFLMSSLVADSERELARRGLARVDGSSLEVMVGGLGLGHTADAALLDPRVRSLDVIELLPEVAAWHRNGLVPLGERLCNDARCRIVVEDCFERLRRAPERRYDAILIDIDDAPDDVLGDSHSSFYSEENLRLAKRWLKDNGVLALWTNVAHKGAYEAQLKRAFTKVEVEDVTFENPLLEDQETNALYFARG